jgi:hypothetical protein
MKPRELDFLRVNPAGLRHAASGLDDAVHLLDAATRREPALGAAPSGWASSAALARLSLAVTAELTEIGRQTETVATALREAAAAYEEADREAMHGARR